MSAVRFRRHSPLGARPAVRRSLLGDRRSGTGLGVDARGRLVHRPAGVCRTEAFFDEPGVGELVDGESDCPRRETGGFRASSLVVPPLRVEHVIYELSARWEGIGPLAYGFVHSIACVVSVLIVVRPFAGCPPALC